MQLRLNNESADHSDAFLILYGFFKYLVNMLIMVFRYGPIIWILGS